MMLGLEIVSYIKHKLKVCRYLTMQLNLRFRPMPPNFIKEEDKEIDKNGIFKRSGGEVGKSAR